MHYVTHRSHRMQKQKFGVTCPDMIFVESVLVLPEPKKSCIDVSCSGCTEMHYVTRRSHPLQKHKFGVTCPHAFYGNRTGPTQA
jgi:hypothetical protein